MAFHKRRKGASTLKITSSQRKFLRQLVTVLVEIIDEKSQMSPNRGTLAAVVEEDESSSIDATSKASDRTQLGLANRGPNNVLRFIKLCKDYDQPSNRVRRLLDALGGGGQTAKALEGMDEAIEGLRDSFEDDDDDDSLTTLKPRTFVKSLEAVSDAAYDVWIAFKDLGVFNIHFSDIIAEMITQTKATSAKIDAEYGQHKTCLVDRYLDQMFQGLLPVFENFVDGLASIAEKEIAAIAQTQDFTSQRYLNLTTVATFLSSVTATTLQMTAENSSSLLSLLMNTIWFISLVFSTASAVYSLLVMTWLRSPVCQPDLSLPPILYVWFQNGPMYALIAALVSFSIGLCLLSFQFADQGEIWISGVVSTTFAVIHSSVISVFVIYYFFELQKREAGSHSGNTGRHYLVLLAKACGRTVGTVKGCFFEAYEQPKKLWFIIGKRIRSLLSPIPHLSRERLCLGDNESNLVDSVGPAIPSPSYHAPELEGPTEKAQHPGRFDQVGERCLAQEAATPGQSLVVPAGATAVAEDGSVSNAVELSELQSIYGVPASLVQFSNDGKLLAYSRGGTTIIYNLNTFTILATLITSDVDEIKEISWYPGANHSEQPIEKLLVYSRQSTRIWDIRVDSGETRMVHIPREPIASVHWNVDVEGFSCVTNTTAKLFNMSCESLRSIDVSKLRKISQVIDAVFVRDRTLLCLVDIPEDMEMSRLLVISLSDEHIQRSHIQSEVPVGRGHISVTLSLDSKKILLRGGNQGTELVELSISGRDEGFEIDVKRVMPFGFRVDGGHQISLKETAAAFYGNKDSMLVGYSGGEVAALYYEPGDEYLSALHIFTTPTTEAMPQRPVSFAVNSGSMPYMFAFGDERGNVTIWSMQSNTLLDDCRPARKFVVHDRRAGHQRDPVITSGKFLTLPLPTSSSAKGR